LPGQLRSAYFIPTFVVPLLLITHGIASAQVLAPGTISDYPSSWIVSERPIRDRIGALFR
jgi:hypothetical protein